MDATYDADVDIVMVYFGKTKYHSSEEIHPGIIVDFDADGRMISLEILNAKAKLAQGALASIPAPDYSPLGNAKDT